MIGELLAALKAVPRIVDALEQLGDCVSAQMAQKRKDDKDETVDDLIAAARERRLHKREAERISRDSGEESDGV
tara:strand:+ start:602 stop:823 length:222 start_codon:yes stop_codon:yes gene_type:complete